MIRILSILPAIFILVASLSSFAQYTECKTDADCKSFGAKVHCRPQKTGCPGRESTSTCVIQICDKNPEPTKMAEFVTACESDKDCMVILHSCHCMYCARPDDEKNGIASAINKKYSGLDRRSQCSAEEKKNCAVAGACAQTGKSIPVCQDHVCKIRYETNQ